MSNKNWFTSGNIERIVVGAENNLASTAGAIAHSIRKNGRCIVETIGAAAEYIGTKSIITARSMLVEENKEISVIPGFGETRTEDGKILTTIQKLVYIREVR